MPRRIVGLAKYGLYASLAGDAKENFNSLFAAIIYELSTDELSRSLRSKGFETREKERDGWLLTTNVMLTPCEIIATATHFEGPDVDEHDGRSDLHDICQFKFKRERGEWRLVPVSGDRLPPPGITHRLLPASQRHDAPIPADARLRAHVASRFNDLIAATGSYFRRSRPDAFPAIRIANHHFMMFVSYSSSATTSERVNKYRNKAISSPLDIRPTEIRLAHRIATAILSANNAISNTHQHITSATLRRTARAVLLQFGRNHSILTALTERNAPQSTIRRALLESLSTSPAKARRLISNLFELGAEVTAAPALRKTNRAAWNTLVLRPLENICATPDLLGRPDRSNSSPTRPKPAAKPLVKAHAKPAPNDARRASRPAYPDAPAPD